MSDERKLAVLIDSDNVSAKYAQFIMQEVAKYGTPTFKRVYGDWEKGGNGWHTPAVNYSIMPVQQTCYVAGKNATDFSMIIDAMDILYTGNVDGFVLVTSDSDFTRLAIRLREAGKLVVGIGELKTPRAFTISCHHFCYLNQVCEPEGVADEKTIRKAVLDYVTENKDERLDLAKISAVLTSRYGNIDFSELGFKRFSNYIDSFPELRRSNTFVSLKKTKPAEQPVPAPVKSGQPTEAELIAAITEYLNTHGAQRDNMIKIESSLNSTFGKVDFSRFGSKRFAKFIDRLDGFTRDGTNISFAAPARSHDSEVAALPDLSETKPVADAQPTAITPAQFSDEIISYAKDNMPAGGNAGQLNNQLIGKYGKNYLSSLGMTDFSRAVGNVDGVRVESNRIYLSVPDKKANEPEMPEPPHETPDITAMCSMVLQYAYENMPDGGNIGQLNNALIAHFGKRYCSELGFEDFKTMLSSVAGVRVRKNFIYLTDSKYAEMVDAQAADIREEITAAESAPAEAPAETSRHAENPSEEVPAEHSADTIPAAETEPAAAEDNTTPEPVADTTEKPEINAVKRDILFHAAADGGVSLSKLGNLLSAKFGKTYLKALGFSSIKKLVTTMAGVAVDGNKLVINEDFAKRTEEIEKFVNEFARGEGSHSVRALSSALRSRFEGFDFRDYGFARFTDFINAIDGVKAERYYVKPI